MTPQTTPSVPSSRRHAQPDFFAWFCSACLSALVVGLFWWHWPETDSPGSSQPVQIARQFLELRDGRLHRAGTSAPFTGRVADFYPNGQLQSRSELVGGRLHGVSEGWHANGVLQVREHFHDGVSHGTRLKWHPNGTKLSEARIVAGQIEDTFRQWHDNGTLAEVIEMKAGKPDGVSRAFYPSGFMKALVVVKDGAVFERMSWPDGELKDIQLQGVEPQ